MSSQISSKPSLKYPPKLKTYIWLYIIFSLVLFIQILFTIPFAIFRLLVIIYIKFFAKDRKQYTNILNFAATMLADDQFTTSTTNLSIVAVLELEGQLNLQNLRQAMEKTLALKLDESTSQLNRYAKLQQYPHNVMGYWFWKNEDSFNLGEHLNVAQFKDVCGDNCTDMEAVTQLHNKFQNKTFPECKSPWFITLIENVPQSNNKNVQELRKTLLVLRLHHCLADGVSTLKLIVEGLGQTKIKTSESSQVVAKSPFLLDRLKYFLKVLVYLIPKTVGFTVDAYLFQQMTQNHHWRHNSSINKNVSSFTTFSKEVPVEMLKLKFDKPFTSVSPSAVIVVAIIESIRKFLKCDKNDNIYLLFTLPKPMHPSFPTNHTNIGTISMPNFEGDNLQALHYAHTLYIHQRDDEVHHLSTRFGGLLLSFLPKSCRSTAQFLGPFTTLISNVAGNNVEFSVDHLPCKRLSLTSNIGNGAPGVVFTIFSYKKLIRFCVMAKENILTKEESQYLVDLITEQTYDLNTKMC